MRVMGRLVAVAVLAVWSNSSLAAELVEIHSRNIGEINKNYKPVAARGLDPSKVAARHAGMLALDNDSSLVVLTKYENNGGVNFRYQQMYRGVPIYGEQVVVSEAADGTIRKLFGRVAQGVAGEVLDTHAKLPPNRALQIAKSAWLNGFPASTVVIGEKARKVIFIDDAGWAHLAYEVSFSADSPRGGSSTQPIIIVDGNTGQVLKKWENLRRANGTGPGGNQKTGLYEYGTSRPYLDVTQNGASCSLENLKVKTVNLNHNVIGTNAFTFNCPRNTVKTINGASSPLNDAHHHASIVHDMFNSYLGVSPWIGKIVIGVHYGLDADTAQWNGPQNMVVLGDGFSTFYPLTHLDVVAHEIAHGFTYRHSALSVSGQAGAVDESFSDISAEAAEFFVLGANDALFGEDVVKAPGANRYFANPTLDGASIGHASNYTAALQPHHAAGVFNKAFYLLSSTAGWDTVKAFKAFAWANQTYWTSSVSFNGAACGVETAAEDLGFSSQDVKAAFGAVGVGCEMKWEEATAIGVYGSPPPVLSFNGKRIDTPAEPSNGDYGMAALANVYRSSGKWYVEFTVNKQRAATEYPYSGGIYLGLRDQANGVTEWAGDYGDWMISWLVDADSEPAAVAYPRYHGSVVLYYSTGPNPFRTWIIGEGDTIGFAADIDTGKIWYSLNGQWIGDPTAGTNPVYDQSLYGPEGNLSDKNVTPYIFVEFQDFGITLRSTSSEGFVHPVPAGFTPWAE